MPRSIFLTAILWLPLTFAYYSGNHSFLMRYRAGENLASTEDWKSQFFDLTRECSTFAPLKKTFMEFSCEQLDDLHQIIAPTLEHDMKWAAVEGLLAGLFALGSIVDKGSIVAALGSATTVCADQCGCK